MKQADTWTWARVTEISYADVERKLSTSVGRILFSVDHVKFNSTFAGFYQKGNYFHDEFCHDIRTSLKLLFTHSHSQYETGS